MQSVPQAHDGALEQRARIHAALGEPHRLRIVRALQASDHTPSQLQQLTGLGSNLMAFHLDVLDAAGVTRRRASEGDGRRRYVRLRWEALDLIATPAPPLDGPVLFVCTRNAARSPLAAALWQARTGRPAASAGATPARAIDPLAIEVARAEGLALRGRPRGYGEVTGPPALVVSVCDRAYESGLPWRVPVRHWSVPDPAGGDRTAYERAFADIRERVDHLAARVATA